MTNVEGNARLEQFRQARRIHGGMFNLCAASLGVKLSRIPIPSRWLRERVYRTVYGKKYRALNEGELDRSLAEFRSLNELFTRGVRAGCRPIPEADTQWLCPCDSTVQDLGSVKEDTLLTVKGIEYSLESLLPEMDTALFRNGAFAIFFLSPADCHRVFAPAAGELREIRHVPGRRLPVHPPYQRREFPVFTLNERVILSLTTTVGRCALVMVAGWGVGNITHPFDAPMRISRRRITRHEFVPPRIVGRGEWIATFELGSTVILITEANEPIVPGVAPDDRVVYGQPAFTMRTGEGEMPCRPR
jgi:phosphatidylserine decarboxylase